MLCPGPRTKTIKTETLWNAIPFHTMTSIKCWSCFKILEGHAKAGIGKGSNTQNARKIAGRYYRRITESLNEMSLQELEKKNIKINTIDEKIDRQLVS